MKLADFNRLKKFMNMTISGSDAEVLMAIKQANKLLEAEGVDWVRVLDRFVRVVPDYEEMPDRDNTTGERPGVDPNNERDEIETAFRRCKRNDFIDSLETQWHEKGFLSPKQKAALFRAYHG